VSRYLLSTHAFVCRVNDHAIVLDLRRDEYTAISGVEAHALSALVRGWPKLDAAVEREAACAEGGTTITRRLLEEGVLTRSETVGKDATPVTLERVTASIIDGVPYRHRLTIRDIYHFVHAWIAVTAMLRFWPLERVVHHVRVRKARAGHRQAALAPDRLRGLIAGYFRLQLSAFSPLDACLRNSLTLIEFLAHYRIYPTWVIGVRVAPWGAHSWVQCGPLLLNGDPAHVQSFTPIMAV